MVETRSFQDDDGTWWEVREINDRSLAVIPPHQMTRPEFADGWLLFLSAMGGRKRLAPVPVGWHDSSEAVLRDWCGQAMDGARRTSRDPAPTMETESTSS